MFEVDCFFNATGANTVSFPFQTPDYLQIPTRQVHVFLMGTTNDHNDARVMYPRGTRARVRAHQVV